MGMMPEVAIKFMVQSGGLPRRLLVRDPLLQSMLTTVMQMLDTKVVGVQELPMFDEARDALLGRLLT